MVRDVLHWILVIVLAASGRTPAGDCARGGVTGCPCQTASKSCCCSDSLTSGGCQGKAPFPERLAGATLQWQPILCAARREIDPLPTPILAPPSFGATPSRLETPRMAGTRHLNLVLCMFLL